MRSRPCSSWLAVVAAVTLLAAPPAGRAAGPPDVAGGVAAEVARTRKIPAWSRLGKEAAAFYEGRLACAEAALRSGRALSGLYALQTPYVELRAGTYAEARAGVSKAGAEAFERDWSDLGVALAAKERRLDAPPARRLPAAVAAIAQSARAQSGPFYQSGRLFGLNAGLDDGLFYMGRAGALLDFALFCRGLETAEPPPGPALAPLADEIARLEADVVTAFGAAGAEARARFPRVNSALKLAAELDARGWREGALLQYLEAALALAAISAPERDRAALEAEIAALDARLERADPRADHSVGALYLQLARDALDGACAADGARRAAAICDAVMPRYFDYVSRVKR